MKLKMLELFTFGSQIKLLVLAFYILFPWIVIRDFEIKVDDISATPTITIPWVSILENVVRRVHCVRMTTTL